MSTRSPGCTLPATPVSALIMIETSLAALERRRLDQHAFLELDAGRQLRARHAIADGQRLAQRAPWRVTLRYVLAPDGARRDRQQGGGRSAQDQDRGLRADLLAHVVDVGGDEGEDDDRSHPGEHEEQDAAALTGVQLRASWRARLRSCPHSGHGNRGDGLPRTTDTGSRRPRTARRRGSRGRWGRRRPRARATRPSAGRHRPHRRRGAPSPRAAPRPAPAPATRPHVRARR